MKTLLCLFLIATSGFAKAKQEYVITTYEVPSLSSENKTSPGFLLSHLNEVIKELEPKMDARFKVEFYPPMRAREKFFNKKVFAILPAFEWELPGEGFIRSDKIATKVDILFYPHGEDPKKIMAKNNHTIAVVRGYPHPQKSLDRHKDNIVYVDNMLAGVKMLRKERVDMLLGDSATTFKIFLDQGIKGFDYSVELANSSSDAYVFAQNTPAGRQFIENLNRYWKSQELYTAFFKHLDKNIKAYDETNSVQTLDTQP